MLDAGNGLGRPGADAEVSSLISNLLNCFGISAVFLNFILLLLE